MTTVRIPKKSDSAGEVFLTLRPAPQLKPLVKKTVVLSEAQQRNILASVEPDGQDEEDRALPFMRIAAGGLLGAGVGYSVSRYRKSKKVWQGALVGAAVGTVGALLWPRKDPDVVVTSDHFATSMGLTVASKKKQRDRILLKNVKAIRYQQVSPAGKILIGGFKKMLVGPVGWLGFLVQHGGACQMYEMAYMMKKEHLAPDFKASWVDQERMEFQWKTKTLMCNRFMETQSPAFDWYGPDLTGGAHGVKADRLKHHFTEMVDKYQGVSSSKKWNTGITGTEYGVMGYNAAGKYAQNGSSVNVEGEKPAANALEWYEQIVGREHHCAHRIAEYGYGEWSKYKNNKLVMPREFKDDTTGISGSLWNFRVRAWYRRAQWFVWACEMARLHCGTGSITNKVCPEWWLKYANSWGIMVPDEWALANRQSYPSWTKKQDSAAYEMLVLPNISMDNWEEIARTLMRVAPCPGAPGTLGDQISNRFTNILDFPRTPKDHDETSIEPPYRLGVSSQSFPDCKDPQWCGESEVEMLGNHWNMMAAGNWLRHTEIKHLEDTMRQWILGAIGTILSVITNIAGGLGTVASLCFNAVYTVCAALVQIVVGLCTGTLDAAGVIGAFMSCVTSVVGALGMEITDVLPDGVWDQLKTFGAEITAWGGAAWSSVEDFAQVLQTKLAMLSDPNMGYGWNYLDEAFGGLFTGSDEVLVMEG